MKEHQQSRNNYNKSEKMILEEKKSKMYITVLEYLTIPINKNVFICAYQPKLRRGFFYALVGPPYLLFFFSFF